MRGRGVTGLNISSGLVSEEFLPNLQVPQALKVYQEMSSNNAVIGACLNLIKSLTMSVKWKVDDKSDNGKFLESCMQDISGGWQGFITEALSMLVYGFSFHEVLYKVRRGPLEKQAQFRSVYTDGKIGWQGFPVRSQATLKGWVTDNKTGDVIAFGQDPSLVNNPAPAVDIPLQGNLLFRIDPVRGNPEGRSPLRACYRAWYFLKYIEELEGIGIERSLAGIPTLTVAQDIRIFDKDDPQMVELLGWATELVDGLRQDRNHGLVLPEGFELNLIGPQGKNNLDTDKIIRRLENRIAMCFFADIMLLGDTGSGSFALSETKLSLLVRFIESIINGICDVLNTTAVPQLFIANGMLLDEYPKISTEQVIPPSLSDIALMLRAGGLDVTSNIGLYNKYMDWLGGPKAATEADMAALSGKQESFQDATDNQFK